MSKINEFINLLFDDKITNIACTFFQDHKKKFLPRNRDKHLFLKYFRAYLIDTYKRADKDTKEFLFNCMKDGNFDTILAFNTMINLNASLSKAGDNLLPIYLNDIDEVLRYLKHPLYKQMANDDKYLEIAIRNECHLFTIDEIQTLEPEKTDFHEFTNQEKSILKSAPLMIGYIFSAHMLYDEMDYDDEELYCKHSLIKNPLLKKYVYHKMKDDYDEFNIVDLFGRIMRYSHGDISFYRYTIHDLIKLSKLFFIRFYVNRNDSPSDIIDDLIELEKDETKNLSPEEMWDRIKSFTESLAETASALRELADAKEDDEDENTLDEELEDHFEDDTNLMDIDQNIYDKYMTKGIDEAWNTICEASKVYSQRMIAKERKTFERVEGIIKTYKL